MNFLRLPFLVKLTLVVVSVIGLGYLLALGQSILAPFFLAFLMAMLFLPAATFMEKNAKVSKVYVYHDLGFYHADHFKRINLFFQLTAV